MYYGLIVQSRQKTKRPDGSSIKFQHNKVLALDDKQKLVSIRHLWLVRADALA